MLVRNLDKIKEEPASHEDPAKPGSYKKVLFSSNDFPGDSKPRMLNWARIPQGRSFRLHLHEDMLEIFIVTKGSVFMQIGAENRKLVKGDAVLVPEKTEHKMTNTGSGDVEYFVVGLSRGLNGKTIVKEK